MHDFANNAGRQSKKYQASRGLSAIAELLFFVLLLWYFMSFMFVCLPCVLSCSVLCSSGMFRLCADKWYLDDNDVLQLQQQRPISTSSQGDGHSSQRRCIHTTLSGSSLSFRNNYKIYIRPAFLSHRPIVAVYRSRHVHLLYCHSFPGLCDNYTVMQSLLSSRRCFTFALWLKCRGSIH